DGRQGHRLWHEPGAGDCPDAHRAVGNGGRGHPNEYRAASRAAERHPRAARRRVDSLPRAEARPGADQEEVMPLLALRVEVPPELAEPLSDALLEQGAQSVCIEAPEDPAPVLSAIFAGNADPERALETALARCDARAARYSVGAVEDDDWVRRSQA